MGEGKGAHLTYINPHIARFGVLTAIFGHQVKSEYTCIFHHACVPHPHKWFSPWFSTIFWFVNRFLALYRYIPYRYFRARLECPKSRHDIFIRYDIHYIFIRYDIHYILSSGFYWKISIGSRSRRESLKTTLFLTWPEPRGVSGKR